MKRIIVFSLLLFSFFKLNSAACVRPVRIHSADRYVSGSESPRSVSNTDELSVSENDFECNFGCIISHANGTKTKVGELSITIPERDFGDDVFADGSEELSLAEQVGLVEGESYALIPLKPFEIAVCYDYELMASPIGPSPSLTGRARSPESPFQLFNKEQPDLPHWLCMVRRYKGSYLRALYEAISMGMVPCSLFLAKQGNVNILVDRVGCYSPYEYAWGTENTEFLRAFLKSDSFTAASALYREILGGNADRFSFILPIVAGQQKQDFLHFLLKPVPLKPLYEESISLYQLAWNKKDERDSKFIEAILGLNRELAMCFSAKDLEEGNGSRSSFINDFLERQKQ